jgi:hypothetical protein
MLEKILDFDWLKLSSPVLDLKGSSRFEPTAEKEIISSK